MESGSIDRGLIYLIALFIGLLVTANLIASVKLVNLFGFILPVAFVAYSFTFTITDIISEIYGKEIGYYVVRAGLYANILVLIMVFVGGLLPPLKPEMQEQYMNYFIGTGRIVVASLIAYIVSQHHDIWAFHWWKQKTGGKYLWLRNNASTSVSQLIDTVLFISIAFYGTIPLHILLNMILSQYLWKLVVAAIDTPFVYLGVKVLRHIGIINKHKQTIMLQ